MKRKIIEIPVLTPSEGMMLTNGVSYSKEVWLGKNDSEKNWREITEDEYNKIMAEQEAAMAEAAK